MKDLTKKQKRDLGYKIGDALELLNQKMEKISIPSMNTFQSMIDEVTRQKSMLEAKLTSMTAELAEKGVEVKPTPKRGRPKKKR